MFHDQKSSNYALHLIWNFTKLSPKSFICQKTTPLFFQNLHLERYILLKTSAISNNIRTLKIEKMISIASFSKIIHILKTEENHTTYAISFLKSPPPKTITIQTIQTTLLSSSQNLQFSKFLIFKILCIVF